MIRSFRNKETERVFRREGSRRLPPDLLRPALRKLVMIDAADSLLELLAGTRAGQISIRINDQRRICFRWTDGGAHEVEITDYH
jgi:proteic killer suppression protein